YGRILFDFRLPRALTALLAGAALGVSGLFMQTLFRNPLAGPSVLGLNAGASLGVALVVLAVGANTGSLVFTGGLSLLARLGITTAAVAGSFMVLLLILFVSRRVDNMMTLLILGIMFGYAANAVVSILMHFSVAERVQSYVSWSFGSFGGVSPRDLKVFLPVILFSLVSSTLFTKPLDALLLGSVYAESMGLEVRRNRRIIIFFTALLSGTVTAYCGPVTFLGIAVPHLARGIFRASEHRIILPATVFLGAAVALAADFLSHLPGTRMVLPLNAVTSLLGAPVLIWVILKERGLREDF
ncbi:MAG: iron ABC transporter permease, partial [Spirochaetales bacterium]|nr:iron ABC transporter permease [Spirochaetales bacterium]